MDPYHIILASQSPRRKMLLRKAGFNPVIHPANIDETLPEKISPEDAVMFLSLKKAMAEEATSAHDHPENLLIIAADTVVFMDDMIMGKPKDRKDAWNMLSRLRGKSHEVATGVSLISITGRTIKRRVFCDTTRVYFTDIPDQELQDYINTEEPYDKAGGYAVQGTFSRYTDHIEGDYDTVVGLPVSRLIREVETMEKL